MDARQITTANIAALNAEYSSLSERRLAHLRELARYIRNKTGDIYDYDLQSWLDTVRRIYRDTVSGINVLPDDICESNLRSAAAMRMSLDVCDRVFLCRALINEWEHRPSAEEYFASESVSAGPNRIAYLRNAFTDSAYSRFSGVLFEPTVTYCDDFTSVCEDVYYGRAGLCILPIENSTEGRLPTFRNLINRYELKIVMTCLVTTSENGAETRFALLKKNIEMLHLTGRPKKTDLFEFSVIINDNENTYSDLAGILTAAGFYGLRLYKADSVPVSYSDTEYAHDLVFVSDGAELDRFIFFLSLEAPQFIAVGIYPHLL